MHRVCISHRCMDERRVRLYAWWLVEVVVVVDLFVVGGELQAHRRRGELCETRNIAGWWQPHERQRMSSHLPVLASHRSHTARVATKRNCWVLLQTQAVCGRTRSGVRIWSVIHMKKKLLLLRMQAGHRSHDGIDGDRVWGLPEFNWGMMMMACLRARSRWCVHRWLQDTASWFIWCGEIRGRPMSTGLVLVESNAGRWLFDCM